MHTFLVVCIFFIIFGLRLRMEIFTYAFPRSYCKKNVAYGNKNKFFLHIYIFFCTFANVIEEKWVEI